MLKIRDELEKRGKEFQVHAVVRDRASEQKALLQSKTAEALFEIFFRVLKHCSYHVHSRSCYEHEEVVHRYIADTCQLFPVSLKGLARHAHVMSVEYFEDLLQVRKTTVIAGMQALIEKWILCCSTTVSLR